MDRSDILFRLRQQECDQAGRNEGVAATSDKERDAKFAAAAKLVSEDAPADWLFNYRITTATAKGVEGFPFDLNQTVLPLYNVTYTK